MEISENLHGLWLKWLSVFNVSSTTVCPNVSNSTKKGAYNCFLSNMLRRLCNRLFLFFKSVTLSWSFGEKWPVVNISSAISRGSSSKYKTWKWSCSNWRLTENLGPSPFSSTAKLKLKKKCMYSIRSNGIHLGFLQNEMNNSLLLRISYFLKHFLPHISDTPEFCQIHAYGKMISACIQWNLCIFLSWWTV